MISLPLLLGLGLFFADCFAFPSNEVEALTAFKRAIFEDPLLVLSNWNPLVSDPCNWSGVYCSNAGDHVVKINISDASIKGFIAPEFHKLSALQELLLHGNLLIGTIPKEIGRLTNLRVLDLGSNQLTGSIPHEIGNLTGIQKINLQSNVLTGKLPYELGTLRYLEELRLDRNKLLGTIPAANGSDFSPVKHGMYASNTSHLGFCGASQLKVFDLSHNFFVGSIPGCLDYVPRSSFLGNCLQDKDPKQRPAAQCGNASPNKTHTGVNAKHKPIEDRPSGHQSRSSKPVWILVLEIVTGFLIGSLFVVAVFTIAHKWKRRPSIIIPWKKSSSTKDYMTMYIDSEAMKDVVKYSREELELACEDFSNIIGSSPDSVVYKGTVKGGPEIAVISFCIKEDQWTGYLELYFQKEVADLARLNHENTGKLLGYCRESSPFTRMLVFEYASNGTLHEHLHYGEGCQFSWTRRMKIIIGIARGLKYLHTQLDPPFTISELNSSSVYLTDDFSPKLVDFECWKTIISRSEKSSGTISNEGAVCILPSSMEGRHLDVQGNIYAFGILLLEIVSGRPPYCKEKGCLVDWAKEFLEIPDVMSYVVDRELKHFRYEDLKVICEVVNLCIHPNSSQRTTMRELCSMLENGIDTSISAEMKSSLAWAELALGL
ncbi:probable LRR receptor-like serine/threonine-protein kinase At1g63430 [Salvia hispanica]|uniref:probable LRR receptor-like serine/threonine-protein kinase At1g63430 n=1 Tax=Salvia hispanica TaxID=49212 RepID=UPI002008F21F|nr:probable LRR receptor-like serine/threonine-protein kinase At1g63430 [Salvia hispanica]XP_047952040.1 probable LRR receptor-like serine/threonine-protein kinase At1g63430 [Salvia hispanica]